MNTSAPTPEYREASRDRSFHKKGTHEWVELTFHAPEGVRKNGEDTGLEDMQSEEQMKKEILDLAKKTNVKIQQCIVYHRGGAVTVKTESTTPDIAKFVEKAQRKYPMTIGGYTDQKESYQQQRAA